LSLRVVFRRAARAEFDDAAAWYEQRRNGLGLAFVAATHLLIDQIAAQPALYPQVYRGIREALVSSYPYCVYFVDEPNQLVILSVFHTARDPSIWQNRA